MSLFEQIFAELSFAEAPRLGAHAVHLCAF
jgi:hypothetical protein